MASLCVQFQDGVLVPVPVSLEQCSSYVLLDTAEYVGSTIWQVPDIAELSMIWGFAFTVPLLIYLMAWSVGTILRFITRG